MEIVFRFAPYKMKWSKRTEQGAGYVWSVEPLHIVTVGVTEWNQLSLSIRYGHWSGRGLQCNNP
jgi:hypothetical protein